MKQACWYMQLLAASSFSAHWGQWLGAANVHGSQARLVQYLGTFAHLSYTGSICHGQSTAEEQLVRGVLKTGHEEISVRLQDSPRRVVLPADMPIGTAKRCPALLSSTLSASCSSNARDRGASCAGMSKDSS